MSRLRSPPRAGRLRTACDEAVPERIGVLVGRLGRVSPPDGQYRQHVQRRVPKLAIHSLSGVSLEDQADQLSEVFSPGFSVSEPRLEEGDPDALIRMRRPA